MTPSEAFKAGRLADAIDAQVQEVKAHPADNARRLFLFELLCFAGELDRARKQINVIQYDDPPMEAALGQYRMLLQAEEARRGLFAAGQKPAFLVDPPFHVRMRLDAAMNSLRDHRPVDAAKLLTGAESASRGLAVVLNGTAHETFRDADDLFGPVLEVMAMGSYFWVALEQVESIAMNPPKYPRDLIWAPARLAMRDGPTGEVYLPALYPNSHNHPDDLVKLGRQTDWNQLDDNLVLGVGGRTFLAGDDAVPLLEWRELQVVASP